VIHVELTDVYWFEVTVFTVVFLVDCVWIPALNNVSSVDRIASVAVADSQLCISEFKFSRTAYRAGGSPCRFINLRKFVSHHDLVDRVLLLSYRSLRRFRLRSTRLTRSHQRTP
jgi:hypothetical protein